MTRHIKRGGKVWINVFPDKPVTEKPAETRMGSGKGNPERWVAVVKPGRILFELVVPRPETSPREALERAIQKLPIKARFVARDGGVLMAEDDRAPRARPTTSSSTRLAEAKQELFNLRFQHVTGQLDNYRPPAASCARTSPASTPSSASREIAAAEALAARGEADG